MMMMSGRREKLSEDDARKQQTVDRCHKANVVTRHISESFPSEPELLHAKIPLLF